MEDKLEALSVGMFIRTPLGIDKIIYLRKQDEYGCNFDTQLEHNLFLNNERDNISIDGECFEKEEIKTSYNIIDILEVGDAIEIDVIDEDNYPTIMGINFARIDNEVELASIKDMLKNESAKLLTVITHEQMEQRAYKVMSE